MQTDHPQVPVSDSNASLRRVQQFMLGLGVQWMPGTVKGVNVIGTRMVMADTLNLPVDAATPEQRAIALEVLNKKFGIHSKIVHSQSMGGIDVIRVVNNGPFREADKLRMARLMSAPGAWSATWLPMPNGIDVPHLNLNLNEVPDGIAEYAKDCLKGWGIISNIVQSRSLAPSLASGQETVRVLRVEGAENIAKLRQALPDLAEDAPASQATATPAKNRMQVSANKL